jgi:hypothetical protein
VSKKKASNDYPIGYRKPPKNTQFQKGISGNPSGRPKKASDLDADLLRELNSPISINEHGKRKRIPRIQGILKQLGNKALTGDIRAARVLLPYYQQAVERAALAKAQVSEFGAELDQIWKDATDEELDNIVLEAAERIQAKRRKGEDSETEGATIYETTDARFMN